MAGQASSTRTIKAAQMAGLTVSAAKGSGPTLAPGRDAAERQEGGLGGERREVNAGQAERADQQDDGGARQ